MVARRFAAHAIRSDLRHRTRLPKRCKAGPSPLTATEYELLRVLALDAGRVVTDETHLRRIWHGRNPTPSNPVRALVRSLRRTLGDDAPRPAFIFNERGVGYRIPGPGEAGPGEERGLPAGP